MTRLLAVAVIVGIGVMVAVGFGALVLWVTRGETAPVRECTRLRVWSAPPLYDFERECPDL